MTKKNVSERETDSSVQKRPRDESPTQSSTAGASGGKRLSKNAAKKARKLTSASQSLEPTSTAPAMACNRPLWVPMRPITRLWSAQYMKALIACSKPDQIGSWYNIRVLANPPSAPAPNTVVQVLLDTGIVVKEIVALDLGWNQGEWMVQVEDPERVTSNLHASQLIFTRGLLMGGHGEIPEIEFLITPIDASADESTVSPVMVSIVLMGIPFYNSDLDLGLYLFEAITAQNKNLGIRSVNVQQRYKIGGAQTNDVRCHVTIDPAFIHKWDLEKPMKVVIQGWNNEGVPRPEMWPVTMRYVDECLICGGFYHHDQGTVTVVECRVLKYRSDLFKRREAHQRADPGARSLPAGATSLNPEPNAQGKTSIGFIVAT